jgi:hypothetical protein
MRVRIYEVSDLADDPAPEPPKPPTKTAKPVVAEKE